MRNENNFSNKINYQNASIEADFICTCGCDTFFIQHTGLFRKSIFGGVSIIKKNKQLVIKAKCSQCHAEYLLYDSTKDGISPNGILCGEFYPLCIHGENTFQINLKYNFMEENYKTDKFEMFFLDVKNPAWDNYLRICEM